MRIVTQPTGVSSQENFAVRMTARDQGHTLTTLNWPEASEFPSQPFMPVGSVAFCMAAFQHMGIDTRFGWNGYPTSLLHRAFFRRNLFVTSLAELQQSEWPAAGWFIKPIWPVKAFSAQVHPDFESLITHLLQEGAVPAETDFTTFRVYLAEPVRFVSEWRYYIVEGEIMGSGRYDDGTDLAPTPKVEVVQEAITQLKRSRDLPAGFALDFGVLDDLQTTELVEANDGWALGLYKGSLHREFYFKLLQARFREIQAKKSLVLRPIPIDSQNR
ncbi:ATP-grasp domain-containing protein [Acidithiobacillus thiooxidans]|uniref:ATP-grasp domain-containing protein n=1 Tax=Acidithiobacillus thiooxidans TaxID=930 RepID=UPI0004B5943A|nr:ATP-grasp domain-containing protein [Acidithiobacillus thiooxidans]